MKNLTKKLLTIMFALLMVVANVHSVAAVSGTEEATVTIDNVDKGSTVKFYRVAEPNIETGSGNLLGYKLKTGLVDPNEEIDVTYTEAGQTQTAKMLASILDTDGDGFVDAAPVTISGIEYTFTDHKGDLIYDMTAPTQEQINKAVSKDLLGPVVYPSNPSDPSDPPKTIVADENNRVQQAVTAGQYIVIITPVNSDSTYNPVVVSAGYKGQQKYKIATTADPQEAEKYYKKLNGTFTQTPPIASTKHEYEADAWDATANDGQGGPANPKWIADGPTTEDALIAKDLNANSNYSYVDIVGTTALAKKQKPDVKKDAVTDHPEENVQVALVATDAKGDTKLQNGELVYIKSPFKGDHYNNTKNGTESYKLVDGVVSKWVEGTDDASLKVALSDMETPDAHLATTISKTAYNAGQGEEVRYTVTPTIPQYPVNAKNKTLSFTDKFDAGIDFVPGSIDIYVDSNDTPLVKQYDNGTYLFVRPVKTGENGNYILDNGTYRPVITGETGTYVLVAKAKEATTDGNTFQINFDYDALPQAEGSKEIKKITYKGVINDEAVQGIPGNVNVVKMHYSNSTGEGSTWKIEKFEEPSGEGITEQHDEGVVYTYEIRFVKTNDKDQYITVDSANATHVRIPDAEVPTWSEAEKTAYATLVSQAIKGYTAEGTEHLYVTTAQFQAATSVAGFPASHDLDKGLYKPNPDFALLEGAVFGLYDEQGNLVCEITTDGDGVGHTTNVHNGEYTLKEITPPAGYTKSNAVTTVRPNWTSATTWSTHSANRYVYTVTVADATDVNGNGTKPTAVSGKTNVSTANANEFAEDQVGWLVGTGENAPFYENEIYDVKDNTKVTSYDEGNHKMTLANGIVIENIFRAYLKEAVSTTFETSNTVYNNNGGTVSVARINNTKTSELPSTGGIGTYLFTIAGVAIIATAAFMLIFRKKEGHNH